MINVLLYQWGSINDQALESGFNQLNNKLNEEAYVQLQTDTFSKKMSDFDMDPDFAMELLTKLSEKSYVAVFSFDYFPLISSICQIKEIKYISWVYDAPHKTLYSKTVPYKGNYIFVFDRVLYEKLKTRGIENIYYEPLAVNTALFDKAIADNLTADNFVKNNLIEDRKKDTEICNQVTFVGSLYQDQHNYYEQLTDLDRVNKHIIDEMANEQTFCYKEDLINSNLSEETAMAICDVANLYLDDKYNNDILEFAADLIRKKVTVDERSLALSRLAEIVSTGIFTESDTSRIPKLINYGYTDYWKEMPIIFHKSAINLNITLRSIQSGIPLRVLDILACEGFLIANWQKEIEEYFEIDKEIVVFYSLDDLIEKVRYYMNRPLERKAIAKAGKEKVQEFFSYQIRLYHIFRVVDFLYLISNIYGYTLPAIDYFEEKFGAFSTEVEQVKILKMIDEMERAAKKSTTILKLIDSEDAIFEVFTTIKFFLRRMELSLPKEEWISFAEYLKENNISMIAVMKIAEVTIFNKISLSENLIKLFDESNMAEHKMTTVEWLKRLQEMSKFNDG